MNSGKSLNEMRKMILARFEQSLKTPTATPTPTPRNIIGSADVGDSKKVIQNPEFQLWTLQLLTTLENAIYSEGFRTLLEAKLNPVISKSLSSREETFINLYKFYLKGGAAVAIALSPSYELPFPIDSDFDVEIIINPELPTIDFEIIRLELIKLIETTLPIINQSFWPRFSEIIHDAGFMFHTPKYSYQNIAGSSFILPESAPFYIKTNKSLGYFNKESKAVVPLHTALIKIVGKTYGKLELIDISIPSQENPKLRGEWISESLPSRFIMKEKGVDIGMSNPLSLYIDQKISAVANIRPNKKERRTMRAARIRNTILEPRKTEFIRNIGRLMETPLRDYVSNLYNKSLENSLVKRELKKQTRKSKAVTSAAAAAAAKKAEEDEEALLATAIAQANKERAERRDKLADAAKKRANKSAQFHKGTIKAVELNVPTTVNEAGIKKMFENAGIPIMRVSRVDTSLQNDLKSMIASLVRFSTERHKANPSPETSAEQARILALAAYIYERPQEELNAALVYAAMTEEDPEGVVAAAIMERSRLQEMDAPIELLTFAEATVSVAVMILEMKEALKRARKA